MTNSLIFFGSDQYSAIVLSHLLTANSLQPTVVITDHKKGGTNVEKLAKKHNLKVLYYQDIPHSLITKDTLGLCASFDHLIPAELITSFAGRLYNLHPSLLPQYRNVSPVQYAIALGDQVTGITLFRISPGIDDGEIISQVSKPILPDDTTPTLTTRLFELGADLFIQMLQGSVPCNSTNDYKVRNLVTHHKKIIFTKRLTRDSGYLEWPTLHKLLLNQPLCTSSAVAPEKCLQTQSGLGGPPDTKNELLRLRLSRTVFVGHPTRTVLEGTQILSDLLRALTPWPGVWSLVPTKKSDLRISLVPKGSDLKGSAQPPLSGGRSDPTGFVILIAGKPNPISLSDFTKYYL